MRTRWIRRLLVGLAVCTALGIFFWLPSNQAPPTPLVGGVPAGPFTAARTPAAPSPRVVVVPPGPEPTVSPEATPTPTSSTTRATQRPTATWTRPASSSTPAASSPGEPLPATDRPAPVEPAPGQTQAPAPLDATPAPVTTTAEPSPTPTPTPTPSPTPTGIDMRTAPVVSTEDVNDVCNTERVSFLVTWTAVSGAQDYSITASGLGLSYSTAGLSHEVACPTTEGPITITVVGRDGNGAESAPGTASVRYNGPMGGPQLQVALTQP